MSGQPGRSGGHNRKTWPQAVEASRLPPWQPSPDVLAGLGDAGRGFLVSILDTNAVDALQGALLTQAAQVLDSVMVWRSAAVSDKSAARLALTGARTFAALCAQVRNLR